MRNENCLLFSSAFSAIIECFSSEANLKIPELSSSQNHLLMVGLIITILGIMFGWYQFQKVKKEKAHSSMLEVANIIFQTCRTYLIQQGRFLTLLFLIIAAIITFYFGCLQLANSFGGVLLILFWTIIGIL